MSLSNFTPPLPNKEKRFNGIDPLDGRYFDPEISQYLSEESRILYQAHVEAALAHTLADFGLCSESVANEIDLAAHSVRAQEVSDEGTCKLFSGNGYVRFESENPISSFSVVNLLGQRIFTATNTGGNSIVTPTQGWAAGLYLARYVVGTKSKGISFIITE